MTKKKERTIADIVAEATTINRAMKLEASKLESLKVLIRAHAALVAGQRHASSRTEKLEIESPEGVATVSFPKDAVVLSKGANPRGLDLPEATWDRLFDEEVVLVKDFEEAFKLLTPEEQARVRPHVEWKPREPTVLLPK